MLLPRGTSLTTGAAFIALIALISGLAINSLLQLHTLGTQIHTVVEYHNRKIDLITQTQVASHLRTDSLFRMVLADDPFERDQLFLEYNRAGFLVKGGRNALRRMGFTPEEARVFNDQSRLVTHIESTQDRVIDLLQTGNEAEARQVFVQIAIPIQNAFNLQLADMRNLYHQANLIAQHKAQQTYRHAFFLTLIFGMAATVLALLVAWRTLKKISLNSHQINEHVVALEASRAALHQEATHDPLTGLANRRLFYDRLRQAIRHAHRYGGKVGIL